jgi:hypothetical protein
MKAIMLMTGLLLLTGCAGQPPEGLARLLGGGSCGKPAADQQLSLDMADQMIGEGRPHAGLAHLEQLPETLDQVRLRKAKVLRLLGAARPNRCTAACWGAAWRPRASMAWGR